MASQPRIRVAKVALLERYRVRLTFTDNSARDIDLEPYFHGPIFAPIRDDYLLFQSVSVDSRAGTIVWPNGADIDPDVLYLQLEPAWMQSAAERINS